MAFDYTTANSGTFVRAGKFLKYINTRLTRATTDLPAELTAIVAQAEAADLLLPQEGIATLYEDFKRTVTTERQQLAAYIDRIFTDRDTVLEQLRVPVADLNAVLTALLQDMTDNSREVKSCTVTLGPIVVSGSNVGTGRVLTTKVLDGYNPPLQGAMSHIRYTGLNSELAVTSETMELTCTADNPRDGVSEGSERFEWKGGVPIEKLDWQDEGSGLGPTITVANGAGLLTDGDLENWGSTGNNTPSNWTIGNGTAGTHIYRESGATNIQRGTYSAKMLGDGAQATIGLEQSISASLLRPRRRHLVGVWVKGASVPAAGQIEVHFSGTGYTKTAPTPEVQTVQISGTPTGGTYTLTYTGPPGKSQTTAAIAFDATSATVQAALRLLEGLECVVVTTSAGAPPDVTHSITFRGIQGNIAQLTSTSSLTGGVPVITHATTTQGVEGDCVVIPAAGFPTTFSLLYFWINTPSIIPSDWKLVMQVASTLSNTVAVYWDSVLLHPVDYHGGIAAALVAGATRFTVGDRFTFTVANDNAGVWQTFARRHWRFQLRSVADASEDILDTLAT